MRTRSLTVAAVILATMILGMPWASAAPPSNNDFANAMVVTEPLPFDDTVDTTDATSDATDPAPGCIFDSAGHTVWYAYTPSQDLAIQARTFGSDYDTVVAAYTGTAGNLTEIGCSDDANGTLQSNVLVEAQTGMTYYFMVGGFGDASGTLAFEVGAPIPAFNIDEVAISSVGTVRPRTGVATISGTITCTSGPSVVDVLVSVSQRIGRTTVHASGEDLFACDGTVPWSIQVEPTDGLLVGGPAQVEVEAFGFHTSGFAQATVKLRGH
jgi:hypothetical protein